MLLVSFFMALLPCAANAQCPDNNHPHMIDLGLPSGTKWACCNVGASKPEDYGGYYAWGETKTKSDYTYETYDFFTSWNDYPWYTNIGREIKGTDYDVAYKEWGNQWQMPTKKQFEELIDNCTVTWATQNGINGCLFEANNGNAVFLPATGSQWSTSADEVGSFGRYWSDELQNTDETTPWFLETSADGAKLSQGRDRCLGLAVRPATPATSSGYSAEGKWEEKITNGNMEGTDLYSFMLNYNYNGLPEENIVEDPDNANNHCIKITKDLSGDYPVCQLSINLGKNGEEILPGNKYKFSMRVKADRPVQIQPIGCSRYYLLLDESMMEPIDVSTQWTTFEYEGVVTENQAGVAKIMFDLLNLDADELYFDDISFVYEMGDAFTYMCEGGNELKFTVVSEEKKTCAVGARSEDGYFNTAYTDFYTPGTLYIPQTVEHNGSIYSVKFIGEGAFTGNTRYDNIVIPEGVTYLGTSSFWISLLKSVTIPSTVTRFGHQVFDMMNNKPGLEKVICYIEDPFTIDEAMFGSRMDYETGEYSPFTATLYVPAGCKEKYESTPAWHLFPNIVEMGMSTMVEGETVNFGNDLTEDTDLDGNILGDIFYSIGDEKGSYDAEEGCLVVTKPTSDDVLNGVSGDGIFGGDFQGQFTGLVIQVPAGKGTVKLEAQTTGSMLLKVKIGDNDPIEMELEGKLKVSFPYSVSEETYVYIYGGMKAAGAKGMRKAAGEDALKIYGIEVTSGTDGIEAIKDEKYNMKDSPVYNLSGQRVEKLTKGVFIQNGKKVLVK